VEARRVAGVGVFAAPSCLRTRAEFWGLAYGSTPATQARAGVPKLSELFLRAWKLGILGPRLPWYHELIRLAGERKHDRMSGACELS
jgi:hypothetical protein